MEISLLSYLHNPSQACLQALLPAAHACWAGGISAAPSHLPTTSHYHTHHTLSLGSTYSQEDSLSPPRQALPHPGQAGRQGDRGGTGSGRRRAGRENRQAQAGSLGWGGSLPHLPHLGSSSSSPHLSSPASLPSLPPSQILSHLFYLPHSPFFLFAFCIFTCPCLHGAGVLEKTERGETGKAGDGISPLSSLLYPLSI